MWCIAIKLVLPSAARNRNFAEFRSLIFTESVPRSIQSINSYARQCVCLFFTSTRTRKYMDQNLVVEKFVRKITKLRNLFFCKGGTHFGVKISFCYFIGKQAGSPIQKMSVLVNPSTLHSRRVSRWRVFGCDCWCQVTGER